MADRTGTEIARYRIESLIARGGMGGVWLATQPFPERKVALKLLTHELASDRAFRERFIRESNAAASVERPNIVPVCGAGEADGELYIAMRYVQGEDLQPARPRRPTPPRARRGDERGDGLSLVAILRTHRNHMDRLVETLQVRLATLGESDAIDP